MLTELSKLSLSPALAVYSIIDLLPPGATASFAEDLNAHGQVTGWFLTAECNCLGFVADVNGITFTFCGALGKDSSGANSINDDGTVVGTVHSATGHELAFICHANSIGLGMAALDCLNGANSSAHAINAAGRIVGDYLASDGVRRAFVASPGGKGMTDIGTLGGAFSSAHDINASGQVVGESSTISDKHHAFITGPNGSDMTDLGTLGGARSYAFGINVNGQVAGASYTADEIMHAFVTDAQGRDMTDLGTLGGRASIAYGINDDGQAVGTSLTADADEHAFLYSGGMMIDLNSLPVVHASGWTLSHATAINNRGQIAGYGNFKGRTRAYLLTPAL